MDINQFVNDFAACFDDTEASVFSPDLAFKDLEEWSSLQGLSVIAMCKMKYGVKVTGAEIHDADTVRDVYELVLQKKG